MEAARRLASPILDVAFPEVDPLAPPAAIVETATETARQLFAMAARAAVVQGEMTLTYALVRILEEHSVACYAATTARTVEEITVGGATVKKSRFEFAAFRRYPEELLHGPTSS